MSLLLLYKNLTTDKVVTTLGELMTKLMKTNIPNSTDMQGPCYVNKNIEAY